MDWYPKPNPISVFILAKYLVHVHQITAHHTKFPPKKVVKINKVFVLYGKTSHDIY